MTFPDDAACRGCTPANLMFPDEWNFPAVDAAKAVCARCPVQAECLLAAMTEEAQIPHHWRVGIRGGLTVNERSGKRRPARPAEKCGTEAGFQRHRRARRAVCDACQAAHANYVRLQRSKAAATEREVAS